METSAPNRTVEELRRVFASMLERLTPDIEPATVYVLSPSPDSDSGE